MKNVKIEALEIVPASSRRELIKILYMNLDLTRIEQHIIHNFKLGLEDILENLMSEDINQKLLSAMFTVA